MSIRKKPASRIGRAIYWLVAIFLSLVIVEFIAGKQISDYLMTRGKALAESGKTSSARRYFSAADLIRRMNPLLSSEKRADYSVEKLRKKLASKDKDEVLAALETVKTYHMSELRPEVAWLAENGSIEVSDAADAALQELGMLVRCKNCGAEYYFKIPDSQMPYVCAKCGKRDVYPADRFVLVRLKCRNPDCGRLFIVQATPGEPLDTRCPACGTSGAGRAYRCQSCGWIWIGTGMVTTCPHCHGKQVGGMSVTPQEAEEYYRTHPRK